MKGRVKTEEEEYTGDFKNLKYHGEGHLKKFNKDTNQEYEYKGNFEKGNFVKG